DADQVLLRQLLIGEDDDDMVKPGLVDGLDRVLVGLLAQIETSNLRPDVLGQGDDIEAALGHERHCCCSPGIWPDLIRNLNKATIVSQPWPGRWPRRLRGLRPLPIHLLRGKCHERTATCGACSDPNRRCARRRTGPPRQRGE